jgi:predicted rRNA pseudouridine synthase
MLSLDNCVILLNKPCGHSSHEISAFVKKITGATRTGHAGTLDPEVSGVLPVALGKATKLIQYIAGKDKTYVGIIKFKNPQTKGQIEKLFMQFTGTITQTPPKISAVRKVPRERTIHSLKLLEISKDNPRLALFEAKVDAGTYIRTLCNDIGKKCGGARMEELRRIAVGDISERQCHTMQELIDAVWLMKNKNDSSTLNSILHAPEKFITFKKVLIKESALKSVLSGAQVMVPAVECFPEKIEKGERVVLYCEKVFVGVGIAALNKKGFTSKRSGLAVKLERIHKPKH